MKYKLGKVNPPNGDPRKNPRIVTMSDLVAATHFYRGLHSKLMAAAVQDVDWSNGAGLHIYANDTIGDCVCAAFGNQGITDSSAVKAADPGTHLIKPSVNQVIKMYEKIGGYVPNDPSTDNGCTFDDAYNYMVYAGLSYKVVGRVSLDWTSASQIIQALSTFGTWVLGVQLCQGDLDAFDNGKPWSTDYHSGPVVGGHGVIVGQCSVATGQVKIGTWGEWYPATLKWIAARGDEAYANVTQAFLDNSGIAPNGLTMQQLLADLNQV